jgi:hypothetical protein
MRWTGNPCQAAKGNLPEEVISMLLDRRGLDAGPGREHFLRPRLAHLTAPEEIAGMEQGISIMSGLDSASILNAADIILNNKNIEEFRDEIYPDYAINNVSENVVEIIQSYIHYINKKTWFKL